MAGGKQYYGEPKKKKKETFEKKQDRIWKERGELIMKPSKKKKKETFEEKKKRVFEERGDIITRASEVEDNVRKAKERYKKPYKRSTLEVMQDIVRPSPSTRIHWDKILKKKKKKAK